MTPKLLLLLPFLAATLAIVVGSAPARADDREPVSTVTVQGNGQVLSAPDQASVRLGVVAQAKTAREVQAEVNRHAGAIAAALRKLGIADADVQTSQLNVSPLYEQDTTRNQTGAPRIAGYQASNVVTARIVKLELLGPAIDAGLAAGANQIEGVSFDLSDDRAARAEALERAVAAARGKAEAIAKALGVHLGVPLEVTEGGVSIVQPRSEGFTRAMAMADSAPTPVAAGQVSVDASVTIRYRIAP
ncbi:MAG TPA: SIMPL domain-containing protein [Thermoanaerobaculia bacterium]|nr:SIMPL domain-containing protein [Thermoanaerobaculia bacterium]